METKPQDLHKFGNLSEDYPLIFNMLSNVSGQLVMKWIEESLGVQVIDLRDEGVSNFYFVVRAMQFPKEKWDRLEELLRDNDFERDFQEISLRFAHPVLSIQKNHQVSLLVQNIARKSIEDRLKKEGNDYIPST